MWAKFGQMTGKVISKIKKPKGLKQKAQAVMSKTKVQAKKMAGKTKEIIKNQYEFTKNAYFSRRESQINDGRLEPLPDFE